MLGLLWLRNLRLLSGMRLFSGTRSISRLGAVVVTNDVIVYATQAVFCHGAHKMSQYSEYSEYSEYSALILRVALQSNSVSCTQRGRRQLSLCTMSIPRTDPHEEPT